MQKYELIMKDIKAELLSLYVNADEKLLTFNDYFEIFQKSIFEFFEIKNSSFFVYREDVLVSISPVEETELIRNGIPWSLVEPSFQYEKIVEPPAFLVERPSFREYNQMLLLDDENGKPFGIIIFEATSEWLAFSSTEYLQEFKTVVSSLFTVIYRAIELRANETQYRKLYSMTDLFHSTMDIDLILENVIYTIEENFPDFQVELILSNDQDRQTKVQIKMFDYLSERPATIEAFVSGELTVELANDLNAKIINAPIKGRQAIYGILQVRSSIDTIYTASQKNFIRMLAQASGNALENAKLYHQSHRLISDLQLINETSHRMNLNLPIEDMLEYLQKQLKKSFQPTEIAFAFKGESYQLTDTVTQLFLTEAGEIYLHHVEKHFEHAVDPLFIADFSRLTGEEVVFKSMMAIPMLVEEKIQGYCIVLHEEPYFFSFDSFKLMQSLIHHSSLAISNSILRNRLQDMVDYDHLTGLYARRYLDRYVENSLDVDESGVFLLIDIDNFKHVNDTYGHQIGDEVLVQIGQQLKKIIGTRGICARWGGEELAIYVSNLLDNEAIKLAEEVVATIPQNTNPRVTISGGLVHWKKHSRPEFQEIFLQADMALYDAKNNGKNQFKVYASTLHLHS